MSDLHHYIGGDLSVSPTGDLLLTSGTIEGQQRILRRLMTNLEDYYWHPTYGAGLPKEVGAVLDVRRIRGIVRGQMFQEAIVSHTPDPNIIVTDLKNGAVGVRIQYVDAVTSKAVSLNFDINQ